MIADWMSAMHSSSLKTRLKSKVQKSKKIKRSAPRHLRITMICWMPGSFAHEKDSEERGNHTDFQVLSNNFGNQQSKLQIDTCQEIEEKRSNGTRNRSLWK
jgi:hypothetical protein